MATIAGISGKQFVKGTQAWENTKYQYASSSHGIDHDMNPALVIQPKNKQDIKLTLQYAKEQGIAVAIRTGGHQYSGASSTGGRNIQLDLRQTFRSPEDMVLLPVKEPDDGKRFVFASVSHPLLEFNKFLGSHKLFVPHGQCAHVHLGGHVQTGGYGQLGRSFGLFGDRIRTVYMIDADGAEIEVTKESDADLFFGVLGGSPGNMGVITHLLIEAHRDEDYMGALGLKAIHLYNRDTLKRLLTYVAEMSDNVDFPRNYDLCVSVLSSSFPLRALWPGLDEEMKIEQPDIYGANQMLGWPRSIIVYAQWVPFSKDDKPDMAWFDRLRKGALHIFGEGDNVLERPMSQLTPMWLFTNVREYSLPYVKRAYLTKSTSLVKNQWPEWVTGRIDEIVEPVDNKVWLSCQIQAYGGKNSMFLKNAENGTSYSWRDSTMCAVLDAFHWSEAKDTAEEWQRGNDQVGVGPGGIFSEQDRRVLWGSYGEYDLDSVWDKYHDDRPKYERLMAIRKKADPYGTFTANAFAVKRAEVAEMDAQGRNGKIAAN